MERKQFIKSLLALPLATKAITAESKVGPAFYDSHNGHKVMRSTYYGQVYHPGQTARAFLETLEGLTEEKRSLKHIGILGMNKTITIKYIELYSAEKIDPARYVNSIFKTARSQNVPCIEVIRHFKSEGPLIPDESDFQFVQNLIREGKTENVFLLDYFMTARYCHTKFRDLPQARGYTTDSYSDQQFNTKLYFLSFSHNVDNNIIKNDTIGGELLRNLSYDDLYAKYGCLPQGPTQPAKYDRNQKDG